jgi:hypothetical protein
LQALAEGGQIAQRFDRGARLTHGLDRAIELAQWIGEAPGHREDAPGLVFQHHNHALDRGTHPQLGPHWDLVSALDQADENDVVETELALGGTVRCKRNDMSVGEPNTPGIAFPSPRPLHQDGRRPMDIVERKARGRERLLPGRLGAGVFPVVDLHNGGG